MNELLSLGLFTMPSGRQIMKRQKFNSAFRLCYSLQLVPCYNEQHELIAVYPCLDKNNNSFSKGVAWDSERRCWRNISRISQCWKWLDDTLMAGPMPRKPVGLFRHETPAPTPSADHRVNVTNSTSPLGWTILWVPVIWAVATLYLYLLSLGFVHLEPDKSDHLKFPKSVEDIKEMSGFLMYVKDTHTAFFLLAFSSAFIYKQSFAIPGSVFLNLLAGAVFGPVVGFVLTCSLTAFGATNCYLLSRCFGKSYVTYYFPDRVQFLQNEIEKNKDGLFFFLLFLRMFPMSPNWAMNIVAPLVGIPVHLFFLSVLIGLMPYNFVCVQTGSVLSQISSVSDVFTTWTMVKMALVAVVALVPGLVIKRLRRESLENREH